MTEEKARSANMAKIYGTVFVLNSSWPRRVSADVRRTAVGLALRPVRGFMTGPTFVAVAFGITYLFEQRSPKPG
ncbi:MAG: hypothetical protein U1F11_11005 [Steroidobacteraceae bacterium]